MLRPIIHSYKQSFSGLARETWLLSIVMLINRCGNMAVPFMSLYVTQDLHHDAKAAGLIITIFGVGAVLGSSVGGKLTDMFGFRPVQIYASILAGSFFLLFAFVKDFTILCMLTGIISFFSDAFRPANFTAIAAYAKEGTITRSYSLNRLANNIGWAIGVSMGGILASYNYTLLFYIEGAISIFAGLAILFLLPKKEGSKKDLVLEDQSGPVQKPWKDVFYMKFIILCALFTACFFIMFRVVPLFFKEVWHINEFHIGLILGLNGALIALFEMLLVNRIENKKSPFYYIVLGITLIAIAFSLLGLPKMIPIVLAIGVLVIFTFGEMFLLPFVNTIVIQRSNARNRGLYAGGLSVTWSVGQIIGPSAAFFISDSLGFAYLWPFLALTLFLCAWGFYQLKKQEDKKNALPKRL